MLISPLNLASATSVLRSQPNSAYNSTTAYPSDVSNAEGKKKEKKVKLSLYQAVRR
ncbi:hypothetical protein B7P43_G09828 [Cryptotermes secundus]|uniref:Uncharacterized protein n=1 Tax=Cryptotermes secundus TaxID=105785 RepID=A0A2J7Q366_9NEOP|nr:hypothetical protein B7P43_G09828 [Cryptotermes secundus]